MQTTRISFQGIIIQIHGMFLKRNVFSYKSVFWFGFIVSCLQVFVLYVYMASNLVVTGSDNSLLAIRYQAIMWTNAQLLLKYSVLNTEHCKHRN